MNSILKYRGYTAVVEFDADDQILVGTVIDIRDTIVFDGESAAELTRSFHEAVDAYLDSCARRGEQPDKPYSGHVPLRIDPRLHRRLACLAAERRSSVNSLINEALEQYAAGTHSP